MTASNLHILQSYRYLYRHSLHAVQYAVPPRYVVRNELRRVYRHRLAADFDREKVDKTVAFFQSAAKTNGMAHKILKNLIHVLWWKNYGPVQNMMLIVLRLLQSFL